MPIVDMINAWISVLMSLSDI